MEYIEYDMLLHHHHRGGAYTVKMSLCINIFIGHFLRGECHYSSAGWSNIVQSTAERGNNFWVIIFYFSISIPNDEKKEQNI